jgi:hypothetical protein
MLMGGGVLGIGCASGFWGDSPLGTPQLVRDDRVGYIVYDYLAEITMAIMARARARDPELGYAVDFVQGVLRTNLSEIARKGITVISNAGGVNPAACSFALRRLIDELGLPLRVAVVLGDDLTGRAAEFAGRDHRDMFYGKGFPEKSAVQSINAYLGAFPIARALDEGADIVITGRCVDSALVLGACIHHFGWSEFDWDRLAGGSLAGHVLECGTQVTGGNYTDWHALQGGFHDIGYPLAEIRADGSFICTKARDTGGLVSTGTVAEQILYEIADPQAYVLPDVVCDFSGVEIRDLGGDRVAVTGARGRPAPPEYKVCLTHIDGFRGGNIFTFCGPRAEVKAKAYASSVLERSRRALSAAGLPDYSEVCIEIVGVESHYGARSSVSTSREVDVKLAAKHPSKHAIEILLKEMIGLGLSAPPGFTGFSGARPKASPVVGLYSFLLDKRELDISVSMDGRSIGIEPLRPPALRPVESAPLAPPAPAQLPDDQDESVAVPLMRLAWLRSGDKGDRANIGVIARRPEYFPYLCAALTEDAVGACFAHFLQGGVDRYMLPGLPALNFVLDRVLGGGGVESLRTDPQGKCYAQLLADYPVTVPPGMVEGGDRAE